MVTLLGKVLVPRDLSTQVRMSCPRHAVIVCYSSSWDVCCIGVAMF